MAIKLNKTLNKYNWYTKKRYISIISSIFAPEKLTTKIIYN